MLTVRKLHAKATAALPRRRFYKTLTPSHAGITLGPETAVVKGATLHGQERRALALLSAAHNRPVDPVILRHFEAAERLTRQGQPVAAMIALIHSGFSPLPETEPERGEAIWRLFAAGELLDAGYDPWDLVRAWGYGEALAKFNPDQPRVPAGQSDGGQWTSGEVQVAVECDGFGGRNSPAGCESGGSYGTTAVCNIGNRNLCRECSVRCLGLEGLSEKEKSAILWNYRIGR